MAFQQVGTRVNGAAKKLTALKHGESLECFVVGQIPSKKDPEKATLIIQDETGARTFLYIAGNVKYLVQDGLIKIGLYTKFIRNEDRKQKSSGMTTSDFTVMQDPERSVDTSNVSLSEDEQFAALGEEAPANQAAAAERVSSIKERIAAASIKAGKSK